MRKNIYVESSLALTIIIITLVSAQPSLPSVMAKAGEARAQVSATHSSMSPDEGDEYAALNSLRNSAQRDFRWISQNEMADYERRGARKVSVGFHADGTEHFVCEGFLPSAVAPGKLYKNKCLYPYGGDERTVESGYAVLYVLYPWGITYNWEPIDPNWRRTAYPVNPATGLRGAYETFTQLSFAPHGGRDLDKTELYMCRKRLKDGMHSGKYHPVRGLCYIPWGGREWQYKISDGFDILVRTGFRAARPKFSPDLSPPRD